MVDTEPIRFRCPECAKSIKVLPEHAGKRGKCPRCRALLRAPSLPSQTGGQAVEIASTAGARDVTTSIPTQSEPAIKGRTSKPGEEKSLSGATVPSLAQRAKHGDSEAPKKITLSYPELGVRLRMVPDQHQVADVSRSKKSSPAAVLLEILLMLVAVVLISIFIFVSTTITAVLLRSFFRMSHPDFHKGAVVGGVAALTCGSVMILLLLIYLPYHLWASFCSTRQKDPESCLKRFMRLRGVRPKRAYSLLTDQARSNSCIKILRTQGIMSGLNRVGQVHITTQRSFERYWELVAKTCILGPKWKRLQCRHLGNSAAVLSVPIVISRRSQSRSITGLSDPTEYASKAPQSLDFTASFLLIKREGRWFLASPWLWPFTFRFQGAHQLDSRVNNPKDIVQSDDKEGSKVRPASETEEATAANTVIFDDVSKFCQFRTQLELIHKATNR